MKNAVRVALGVTGVAAKIYAGYILKKEIDRKREAAAQGKTYETTKEDSAKLVVSAAVGIACSGISRSMHISMLKDSNKATLLGRTHFKNYESNLHKLATKYVFQNSGITFSGINSYEVCRTQAANTLDDTAMDDIKNFTAATLKRIEEAIE